MISLGRIVLYTLTQGEADRINGLTPVLNEDGWRLRNTVYAGDVCPAIVVRVFDPSTPTVNLQVFLDAGPCVWLPARSEGDGPGYWAWPEREGS